MEVVCDTPHLIWAPLAGSSLPFTEATPRLYVGQLVKPCVGGVQRLDQALGVGDVTHRNADQAANVNAISSGAFNSVFGVVVGHNRKTPLFSSSYQTEYIDYVAPYSAGTDDFVGIGGPWPTGQMRAMVKIALITPETILRSKINAGTSTLAAPTVLTATASSSGRTVTTATPGWTPGAAGFSSVYFRSGSAVGEYRHSLDTSATVHAWREHLANSTGANACLGDTLVKVAIPPMGKGRMQLGTHSMFVNGNSSHGSHYFWIDVIKLDLSTAGSEYVEFRFDPMHFSVNTGAS